MRLFWRGESIGVESLASENIKKQVTDASRKTTVCSRSVANRVYLTIHRPKNRKVIMHHTQGLGFRCAFCPRRFAFTQRSGKRSKAGYHHGDGILPFCFAEGSLRCASLTASYKTALFQTRFSIAFHGKVCFNKKSDTAIRRREKVGAGCSGSQSWRIRRKHGNA